MIVAKFGGTSVADREALLRLGQIVRASPDTRVIVVSALAGVTDQLCALGDLAGNGDEPGALGMIETVGGRHRSLGARLGLATDTVDAACEALNDAKAAVREAAQARNCPGRVRDRLMAAGELASSRLVAGFLATQGMPVAWVDARDIMVTDDQHTRAAPQIGHVARRLRGLVAPLVAGGSVVVTGGFIGATADGVTTTLGRGGSDFSASIIGAGLGADRIDIWTDVDGLLTADPRVVAGGRVVPHLSFAEASELAYFGAKVLHPSTILPAMGQQIPVRVVNARRPASPGTLITAEAPASGGALRAIACKRDITVITITSTRMLMAHGFLRRVFETFDRWQTVVDVVTTSEISVSVTVDDSRAVASIVEDLTPIADVRPEGGLGLVCAVGERLRTDPRLCAQVLRALGGIGLRMVSQAASRQNLTLVVDGKDLELAMNRLHRRFFERPIAAGHASAGGTLSALAPAGAGEAPCRA